MKYIQSKFILCAALAFLSLNAGAQAHDDIASEWAERDSLANAERKTVQVAYRKVKEKDLLGGISHISVTDLMEKNYMTNSLDNLQGYVGGWNGNSLWGMDGDNAGYLVLIDGVPRDANNVVPSEIEGITFLKGASAVVLFGSRAAKGVIYITTKRGKSGKNKIIVNGNTGFYVPVSYPKYLGSAEYMTLYNEARVNDGLDALYTPDQIYNHGSGLNPYRYPNVDLYSSEYLKKAYNRSDATAEISGGNERARFYTNINLYNTSSLLKFGDTENDNITRFSVRGNVDVNLNHFISTYVNANATFYDSRTANGNFWGAARSLRPNRVSPLIPVSYIDPDNQSAWTIVNNSNFLIDGKYLLGGTQLDQTNALASLYASGYSTYTSRQYQFDMGVNINLARVLPGLSFQTRFAIDYATSYRKSYDNSYATYEPVWGSYNGKDIILSLNKYGTDKQDGIQHMGDSWNRQTIDFAGQFNYNKVVNDSHNISAMLIAAGYQQSESGVYHKISNVNLGLHLDYNYRSKYYANLAGAVIHSARMMEGNRNALSPSITLGWRISSENFLANSSFVDDLMLTASASVLNTDIGITDYYLYDGKYDKLGNWWGWADGNQNQAAHSKRGENKDLTFIKRKEVSIGLRGSLWNRLLTFDTSFFKNRIEGLLVQSNSTYPNYLSLYFPESSFIPYINYNNNDRKGLDFSMYLNKKLGKTDFTLGVSGTYYDTKIKKRNELHEYGYEYRKGHPLDGIWGLVSDGFFKDQAHIDNSPTQSFAEVKPGDIKYVDQNNDQVIDDKDVVFLGERGGWYGAPFTLGTNLTAKWNNFTIFVLGIGNFGASAMKNNEYYHVYGDRKYSEVVRNRWTPETKETATYPRLTTRNGDNNFRDSDFWLYKTDHFKIAKIQLTYDFPRKMLRNTVISDLSLYVSGSDLFTFSKERKALELNVGTAPQNRFYNIGAKISF